MMEVSYPKKKQGGTNRDKTNTTYETIDAQTKKKWNRGTALERSVEKTTLELKPV